MTTEWAKLRLRNNAAEFERLLACYRHLLPQNDLVLPLLRDWWLKRGLKVELEILGGLVVMHTLEEHP